MTDARWAGLDGGNPLHFLASLGILRLLSLSDSSVTLRWTWSGGGWRPTFATGPDLAGGTVIAELLSSWLIALSRSSARGSGTQRRVRDLKADLKKLWKERKDAEQAVRAEAKGEGLSKSEAAERVRAAVRDLDRRIEEAQASLDRASDELTDQLGSGIAHLGDIIGVPVDLFRRRAADALERWLASRGAARARPPETDDPDLVVDALAAQASDGVVEKGLVVPTPYSFSNGASGQCLLKDFRGCAAVCTPRTLDDLANGEPSGRDGISGLNWDPADQRSYALQWRNPEKGKLAEAAPNALAFVGLTLLPLLPGSRHRAVAWRSGPEGQAFSWPLWEARLRHRPVRALLATSLWREERSLTALRPYGIVDVRESARINPTGKRPFFAPSRSL